MSETGFSIARASWESDGDAIRAVREQVYIIEQLVPGSEEWDGLDARSLHVLARDSDGHAIGTGRLTPDRRIGRMAVLREWRGRGVGAAMLAALLAEARTLGHRFIDIHAQSHALGFYARFGFEICGEEFLECAILHRPMRLDLGASPVQPASAPVGHDLTIDDAARALAVTLALIGEARRELAIFTRDLDPQLLDVPATLEALKQVALSGRGASIRVLVQEPRIPAAHGHRLIALAQRLPSLLQLRTPLEPADLVLPFGLLLNDRGGYLLRPLGQRFEGKGSMSAPGRHRELLETFNAIWERSAPSTELRTLDL
ncbi:MAG TPA: GNAT family N-acetyltransferase [Rhodanobacteraceae bacterium]|nr:GNAT family N-acetyltransferase [Rhodanobacteraceae bacterium]